MASRHCGIELHNAVLAALVMRAVSAAVVAGTEVPCRLVVELTVVPAETCVSPLMAGKLTAGSAVTPVAAPVEPVVLARIVLAGYVVAAEHGAPASMMLPLASHFAQLLAVNVPVALAVFEPLPVKISGV